MSGVLAAPLAVLFDFEFLFGGFLVLSGEIINPVADRALHPD